MAGYRSAFGPDAVHTLRRMVARHYQEPHQFVCVTDDTDGLDPDVETFPLWSDHADVPSPHGGHNPSCYRRLKLFSVDAETWFGKRFVCVDLDTVIVNDLAPLWNRTEDFVIWGSGTDRRSWYNGSMFMLRAGTRRQVWEQFNPKTSPNESRRAGRYGSDQGWISHILGRKEAMWTIKDGVYSFRVHLNNGTRPLPPEARIVCFHGRTDPWSPRAQALPWVQACYQ